MEWTPPSCVMVPPGHDRGGLKLWRTWKQGRYWSSFMKPQKIGNWLHTLQCTAGERESLLGLAETEPKDFQFQRCLVFNKNSHVIMGISHGYITVFPISNHLDFWVFLLLHLFFVLGSLFYQTCSRKVQTWDVGATTSPQNVQDKDDDWTLTGSLAGSGFRAWLPLWFFDNRDN